MHEDYGGAALTIVSSLQRGGAIINLSALTPSDVDFEMMARRLARMPRWCGEVAPGDIHPISVAQHSVMGAEALDQHYGDRRLSAAFLLHDAHEYLIGDIVTPAMNLMDICNQVGEAKRRLDCVIFAAGNMPGDWPRLYPTDTRRVTAMDRQMALFEAAALFGPSSRKHMPAPPRDTPKPIEAIRGWGPEKAHGRFVQRLRDYCGIDLGRASL